MKKRLYTLGHDIELLKAMHNDEGQFTAEEHANIVETELGRNTFPNKEELLGIV